MPSGLSALASVRWMALASARELGGSALGSARLSARPLELLLGPGSELLVQT